MKHISLWSIFSLIYIVLTVLLSFKRDVYADNMLFNVFYIFLVVMSIIGTFVTIICWILYITKDKN
jgi:hypothetical protein